MSSNNYITLRQENERWGWSRHTVGMTFTSHATYSTRALAEDAARSIAKCKDIPYLPTARGGFDRTPTQTPEPIDPAPTWLAEQEPAPAPPQSQQDVIIEELTAAAVAAGHDHIRVLKAVDLVKGGHVFEGDPINGSNRKLGRTAGLSVSSSRPFCFAGYTPASSSPNSSAPSRRIRPSSG